MSRISIFIGRTLSQKLVAELVPNAAIYPPVAANDLLKLELSPGDIVVIIDGYFYQSASVRHKEILDLLKRGVHVWGAASMGALRAAELAQFGMRGFGSIFEAYVNSEIDGDDEVAILHSPADMDYKCLAEALVNIRDACQHAITAGIISAIERDIIVEIARKLPFFERSYPHLLNEAVKQGLSQHTAEVLHTFFQQAQPTLKQRDALECIRALPAMPSDKIVASFPWYETSFIHTWRLQNRG